MTQTEINVFLCALPFLGWLYYQLQKRIGEDQAREWAEWKQAHPQYFKKPEPLTRLRVAMDDEQKKST